jgi:hypothetical protein
MNKINFRMEGARPRVGRSEPNAEMPNAGCRLFVGFSLSLTAIVITRCLRGQRLMPNLVTPQDSKHRIRRKDPFVGTQQGYSGPSQESKPLVHLFLNAC